MLNKKTLKQYIRQLGFDIVGFAVPYQDDNYNSRLAHRVKSNMFYERKKYSYLNYGNASSVLKNAKSVISVGVSYHQINKPSAQYEVSYSKSTYGIDYHIYIYSKMEEIIEFIKDYIPEVNYYLSCDTKALDDRYFAYLCGNGFYGKNTMIINEKYGSEVFYGTIVLDVDLNIDNNKVIESKCNDCMLCEIACPMHCLSDYNNNVKSCLSNLTQSNEMIEYKNLKGNIYGCDICNNVCPYNKDVPNRNHFLDKGSYNALKLLNLSGTEYKQIFGTKSMSWLNKNIIKKNVVLNLPIMYSKDEIECIRDQISSKSKLIENAFIYVLKE